MNDNGGEKRGLQGIATAKPLFPRGLRCFNF